MEAESYEFHSASKTIRPICTWSRRSSNPDNIEGIDKLFEELGVISTRVLFVLENRAAGWNSQTELPVEIPRFSNRSSPSWLIRIFLFSNF